MNPLYNGGNISNLKSLYNAFRQNPQQVIMQMAGSNPQTAEILNNIKGQDLQGLFYNLCKQKGVDPNSILNQLK